MSARIESYNDIRELVAMSIGTNKGTWWADQNFGSELWLLQKTGKIDGQAAGTLRRMICDALQWLVDDGLAKSVDCAAALNGKNRIDYTVTVTRAAGDNVVVKKAWSVV